MRSLVGLALVMLALVAVDAFAQSAVRLRGTITGLDGNVMSVKTREGKDVKLTLADNVTVVTAKAIKLEELKTGDFVGATTRPRADGTHVAIEVHSLAPTTKPGQLDWDLEPGTTMTNGYIGSVANAAGQELVLDYKTGSQKVVVPPNAAVVTFVPGTRADLKSGEYIFAVAQAAADGTMNVQRVSVSKDGVRPPQ